MDIFINLEVLQTPYYWNFVEASSCKHDPLIPFQTLSPFYRMGGGAENSKLLIRVHVSGDEPPSRSHPGTYPESLIRKKDAPSTHYLGIIGALCRKHKAETNILIYYFQGYKMDMNT